MGLPGLSPFAPPSLSLGPAAYSLRLRVLGYEPLSSQLCPDLPPSPHTTQKMAGVCLASCQSLLYFWVRLAPYPKYSGPCSALLGEMGCCPWELSNQKGQNWRQKGPRGCLDYRNSWRERGKRDGETMSSPPVGVKTEEIRWPHLVDKPWGWMGMTSSVIH